MIELRWYKKIAGEYVEGELDGRMYYDTVLQYREKEGSEGESWLGDWKDVPTEWEKVKE